MLLLGKTLLYPPKQ